MSAEFARNIMHILLVRSVLLVPTLYLTTAAKYQRTKHHIIGRYTIIILVF